MAPNGIVSLAKVIYAQASTYSAAQQALSRKSFRTNGIVLEWNAAGEVIIIIAQIQKRNYKCHSP